MASARDDLTFSRISSAAAREATGRGWQGWLDELDAAGAAAWDHQQIVAHLERAHPHVSGWWQQSIAVAYEQARGKRLVGQTSAGGFQIGVQCSVAATPEQMWEVLVSQPGLWLGEEAQIDSEQGARYEVPPVAGAPGASGEVRVVKPADRVRMTWQPDGWPDPATLQLALSMSASGKTTITAHLERLPDADTREAMRSRWWDALERVVAAVAGGAV